MQFLNTVYSDCSDLFSKWVTVANRICFFTLQTYLKKIKNIFFKSSEADFNSANRGDSKKSVEESPYSKLIQYNQDITTKNESPL